MSWLYKGGDKAAESIIKKIVEQQQNLPLGIPTLIILATPEEFEAFCDSKRVHFIDDTTRHLG